MVLGRVIQGAGARSSRSRSRSSETSSRAPARPAGDRARSRRSWAIGGGLGIVLAGPIVEHLSYHWLFWFPLIAVARRRDRNRDLRPRVARARSRPSRLARRRAARRLARRAARRREPGRLAGAGRRRASSGCSWWRPCCSWSGSTTEMRIGQPLVDMKMMRRRGVWTTNLAAFVFGFGMYSSFVLVPEFVESSTSSRVRLRRVDHAGRPVHASRDRGDDARRADVGAAVEHRRFAGPAHPGSIVSTAPSRCSPSRTTNGWQIYLAMAACRRRDRPRVRLDGEPDRRSGARRADGRGHRDEHDRPHRRRRDREPDRRRDRHRDRDREPASATERGFTLAFAASAIALGVGVVVAFMVPRRRAVASSLLRNRPRRARRNMGGAAGTAAPPPSLISSCRRADDAQHSAKPS